MSDQQNNGQRRNNNRNRNRNNNNNRNRNNNRNNNRGKGPRKHTPKPLVLTGWQKFLKAIGLFNEEKARAKQKAQRNTQSKNTNNTATKKPAQSNTRVAKPRRAPQQIPVETPRLYVGNLSYEATEYDIEELFKGIGTVKKVEIIYNRHTHKSKGYGFVQMLNTDEAKRAVEVLHEQPFMGRNMIVNGSKAKKPNDKTGSNSDNDSGSDSEAVA